MAKKQNQQGHKNQRNSGGGRAGSVAENAQKAEAGRERNRKVAKLLEARRKPERESGEFYIRTNADRSNDIDALIRGEIGDYAIPGSDQPSLHCNVQREIHKVGTISAIRLESIQKGHELEGALFDPNVYLPCFYIQKFGTSFKSRKEDRLAAATQELLCHYLTAKSCEMPIVRPEPSKIPVVKPMKEKDPFTEASLDHKSMLSERPGLYLVRGIDGDVIFEVFRSEKANIRVVASRSPQLTPSDVYVPVYCLSVPKLGQVTSNAIYEQQLAIFMFLRNELAELFAGATKPLMEAKAEVKSNLTQADRDAIAKAEAKRARQVANKFVKAREEQNEKLKIMVMRQKVVPVEKIVSGTLGYVDLSSSFGELLLQSGMIGADRFLTVEVLGESHMLKLAGIKVGDSILANFVRFGISTVDRANLHMSEEEYRKKSVLAQHVREQIEVRGIHFIRPAIAT